MEACSPLEGEGARGGPAAADMNLGEEMASSEILGRRQCGWGKLCATITCIRDGHLKRHTT